MATETTLRSARVRRHNSLPELTHRPSILPSSLSLSSKAESTRLQYPRETLVTNNSSAAQNDAPSSKPDLPLATPNSFACDSDFYYRPTSARRKPADGSSVSLPGANGVLRTVTKSLTFDTRPWTAEPFPDGNELTSSDTFDFLRGEHEVSPISSPSPEEDLWPDYLHSVAPTQSFEPAPVNFEDWIDPHLLQLRPSPVEPDATRTVVKTGPAVPYGPNIPQKERGRLSLATHQVRENRIRTPSPLLLIEPGPLSTAMHQVWENRISTPPLPDPLAPRQTSPKQFNLLWKTKACDAAKLEIFTTLTRSGDDKAPKTATLNIAATQRLVLAYQQREISKAAAKLYTESLSDAESDAVCEQLRELIHKHCDVVRDLEYMQQRAADCGEHDEDDPFYLKSSKRIDRLAMDLAGLIPNHVLPAGDLPIARDHYLPKLPGVARTAAIKANKSRHLVSRFVMASSGGLSLVVPVILMASIPGKTSSLVTTCIAMMVFAIGITFGTHLKADQVLGATAAYAAVLVVFVGTSLAESPV